jgi:hypothetical protein
MANNTRLNSIWAENAVTNIPDVPVTGTAYRDESYADNYADGQQYDSIYNSARYNQFFYQVSSLLKELSEQGLLQWVSGQAYQNRAVVFHNNNVFIALRDIPATEEPVPEPGTSTAWLKLVWQAGKGLTTDYTNEAIQFNAGKGLSIDSDNNVNVNVGKGMTIVDDTIMPLVGQGIGLDDEGKIIPKLGSGLKFNADGSIEVSTLITAGQGISTDSTGAVAVKLGAGLKFDANNAIATKLSTALNTDTSGNMYVGVGTDLGVDSSNKIYVRLGNGLQNSSNNIIIKKHTASGNGVYLDGTGLYVDTFPIGSLMFFASNGNPTGRGWLYCNGAAVSRTTYSALFAVIGTTWGAGNGSTTFNLPNPVGRYFKGNGSAQYANAGLPNIAGTAVVMTDQSKETYAGAFYKAGIPRSRAWSGTDGSEVRTLGFQASRSNGLYGASSTVQPVTIGMKVYIKASL